MRQLKTAGLAAAVALVFATAAQAAVTTNASSSRATTTTLSGPTFTTSSGTVMGTPSLNRQGQLISNAPRIAGGNAGASGATSSGTSSTATDTSTAPLQTTVDLRDQQTRAATAGTRASGSTSALGPLANGGAVVTDANGTIRGEGTAGTTTLPPFVGTPIFANPSDSTFGAASVNSPTTMATAATTTNGFASTDVYGNAVVAAPGVVVTEVQINGASVDRAINQVSRDRKRVGRNGQLLYSIAPRSNVDRTGQMPDDPLPPTLTGSNSTLVR